MPETTARALSSNRKKRGTVKASLTRLSSRLRSIESTPDLDEARRLTTRLECLMAEFKVHHYAVLDLIDDEEDQLEEQRELDEHEDIVADLTARLEKVVAISSSKVSNEPRIASKHLKAIDRGLDSIIDSTSSLPRDVDDKICLLQQCEERLSEFKSEFLKVRNSLFSLDLDDHHEVNLQATRTEGRIFDCSVEIKKLLRTHTPPPSSSLDPLGVKLPKLDVPTFDGSILSWKTFWEQFSVSVDTRSNLSDSEKLAYLRHALKGGSAKTVIEGLSRSGDHYSEAIACLKARYDRPRLIHQAHVQKILEAPGLKDGSGKELRRLHDTVLQHLRALKSLDHEPSGPFITSLLELKLDANTMFE